MMVQITVDVLVCETETLISKLQIERTELNLDVITGCLV